MSRLPVKSETKRSLRPSNANRVTSTNRGTSTSRATSANRPTYSNSTNLSSFRRSKSSASLLRTPQSRSTPSQHGSRTKSADRGRIRKKDVRPLQDKNWQARMLEKTQSYFQQFPEAQDILFKGVRIRPITLNMFVQLSNFVLRNIDSKFSELTLANYTELLPSHLNLLKYPGNVTVSMLKTANTIHSWPHVLAILSWLVELHEVLASIDPDQLFNAPPEDASIEVKLNHLKTITILELFEKWNKGNDNEDVENLMQEKIRKLYNLPVGLHEDLKRKMQELTDKLNDDERVLEQANIDISKIEEEENLLKIKDKHLDAQIDEQRQKGIALDESIISRKNDTEKLKKRIEQEQKRIAELKVQIKNQSMSLAEKKEHQLVIEELKNKMVFHEKEKLHLLTIRDEKDIELSELKRMLETKVSDYNIQLLKPALNHPELKDLALREERLCHPDMKLLIAEKLEKRKELLNNLNKNVEKNKKLVKDLKNKIEQVRQEIDQKNKVNRVEQQQLNKIVSEFDALVKSYDEEEKIKQDKITDLKKKILEQKSIMPDIQKKLAELKELKTIYKELEKSMATKKSAMLKFFETLDKDVKEKQIPKYRKLRKDLERIVSDALADSRIPQDSPEP